MSGFRAGKRARTDSISSTSSAGSGLGIGHGSGSEHESETSSSPAPFNKIQRSDPRSPKDALHDLECSLPPTCFPATRSFETAGELERHQLAFHTYICRTPVRDRTGSTSQAQGAAANPAQGVWDVPREFTSRHGGDRWKECRKVFPDERLLDLHQIECHDPMSRQKQRDGLAIFQCFVPPPTCTRTFINPKHRRLHLIDRHKYPRQYYFSITNHGLNRIAEEEGLGASLIRPRREYPASPPKPETGGGRSLSPKKDTADIDMDDLTRGMSQLESSLTFVPIQLRRKANGKGKGKATAGSMSPAGHGHRDAESTMPFRVDTS